MATIIAAAEGKISKRDVYEMITIPSKHSWISSIGMAPAYGLYLANVEYPAELIESNSNMENVQTQIIGGDSVCEDEELLKHENVNIHIWINVIPSILLWVTHTEKPRMSFLSELQSKGKQLRPTTTTVTYCDGTQEKIVAASSTTAKQIIKIDSKQFGFVVDTKPDQTPACILTNFLYLGSQDAVILANIHELQISDVLSIGIDTPIADIVDATNLQCHFVPCLDLPETSLSEFVEASIAIIDSVRRRCGRILVHCNAGVSRSATVCIAYLMKIEALTFAQAYDLVKSKRPCIQPNAGFMIQLKELSENSS